MNKPFRILVLAVVLVVLVGVCALWLGRSRSRGALMKYKAELRAKGEKLSAGELGYPKPPESGQSLDRLLVAADKAKALRFQPSTLDFMPFVDAGQVRVLWESAQPLLNASAGAPTGSYTWEAITAQFAEGADITVELCEAVKIPPRYFYNDPTNFFNAPKSPFVGIRTAAQWLAGDTVVALHAHQLERAVQDIHALTQLTQFHREDLTLVGQMIRVAVAGLGLSATWQASQAQGWNEEMLAGMQKDWEAVNLADSFEIGMIGERAFGGAAFTMMHSASSSERMKFVRLSTISGPVQLKTPKDYFEAYVVMPFWAANADADEMFFLQHHQRNLDSIRKLQVGVPWPEVNAELSSHHAKLNQVLSVPVAKFRYLFSARAIPNSVKAAGVCVRNETQRRLTVTAIALERYKLRAGACPPSLDSLVPQFLSAVPIDLMSAKPLGYRLNPDGSFSLYSVGEDGRDDGGDANSSTVTNKFDLWSGRDAVWPVAATKN